MPLRYGARFLPEVCSVSFLFPGLAYMPGDSHYHIQGTDETTSLKGSDDTQDQLELKVTRKKRWAVNICFLTIGMGASVTWYAVTFAISFFMVEFASLSLSDYFWTFFLLAYDLPGLPIQIIQYYTFVHRKERETTSDERQQYFLPCIVCYILLATILVTFPLVFLISLSVQIIFSISLGFTFFIGIIQGRLFGKIFQLASLFSPEHYSSIPSCMAGVGISTIVLLVVTISEQFNGTTADAVEVVIYFAPLSSIPLLSILSIIYVVRCNNEISQKQEDLSSAHAQNTNLCRAVSSNFLLRKHVQTPLLPEKVGNGLEAPEKPMEEKSKASLFHTVRVPCFSAFLVGLGYVLLNACFPYLGEAIDNDFYVTVAVYLQAIFYFVGNETVAFRQVINTDRALFVSTIIQSVLFIPIFISPLYAAWDPYNIISYAFIILYTFIGSYLNSCSYVIAASAVGQEKKSTAVALLNIYLYLGYTGGLAASVILSFF